MNIVVRESKIVENKLNTVQKEALNRSFLKAKSCVMPLRLRDGLTPDSRQTRKYMVEVKTKDGFKNGI